MSSSCSLVSQEVKLTWYCTPLIMKKADENQREFTVLCLINSFCILVVEWFIFQVVFVIQDGSKKKLWNNPAKNITVHCSLISRQAQQQAYMYKKPSWSYSHNNLLTATYNSAMYDFNDRTVIFSQELINKLLYPTKSAVLFIVSAFACTCVTLKQISICLLM